MPKARLLVDETKGVRDPTGMESYEIRELNLADVAEIEATVRMWRRTRDALQPELEARMAYAPADDLGFFTNTLMKSCRIWIAIRDGDPIALLALENDSIEQLYVDPLEQNAGVGTALVEIAKRNSPQRLTLFTHQTNSNARRFYEARGFSATQFGVSPPPESEPDVKYDWDGE